MQNQAIFFDSLRLATLIDEQQDQLRQTRRTLIFALIGVFGAFILATYVLNYRRILKSLAVLQAGTRIVGSGNLDYLVPEKHNDEIGDLSRAFNRMTTNLKNVTASKAELETEIEERKKAEEKLLTYERLATIGQLSGSIAHEIRNPLATIDSSAFMLERQLTGTDDSLKKHLGRIRTAINSALAVIQSLLNLTRMKEPDKRECDLRGIVAEVIGEVPGGIELVRDFPNEEIRVPADVGQLRMAFTNITANAVQAMDGKGRLNIRIQCNTTQAEVSFTDTGPGIMQEDLHKLFQPLFTTKAKGMGLGLSIAKIVVEKHGGTIDVRSETGKGATVIIRLPIRTPAE